jgi:hypothetical protein
MADEFGDLWGAVDLGGLQADFLEFGTIAVSGLGAATAYNFGVNWAMNKFWPTAPPWARQYGVPAGAILLGLLGGPLAGRYLGRSVGVGVTTGLMMSGARQLLQPFMPSGITLGGLGATEDEVLLGLGNVSNTNYYNQYLTPGVNDFQVEEVRQQVAGLGGAEVGVAGLPTGWGSYSGFAATLQ